jgi:hypothetical protein
MTSTDLVLWWVAVGLAAVVVLVVAVLLQLIVNTARRIHGAVAAIWTGGTHIAANTVTIALLQRTNYLAGELLGSAGHIARASGRIRRASGGES